MPRGTPGFIGFRLSQARKLRRKNISALANDLGMSRATVSAYEKGTISPSPEIMGEICKCLDMPLDFFINDYHGQCNNNGPIFYRSYISALRLARESAEVKNEILSEIVDYLAQYIDFPIINVPEFDVPSDPTALDEASIKEIALKTRKYWGLSLGPISDILCLLENNGIVVGKFPLRCEKLDAFSQRRGRQPQIVVGSDKASAVRQRFDASHELGHIILHRKVPSEIVKDKAFHGLLENQAHLFASEFLIPTEAFKSELRRISINEMINVKRRWKISIGAQVRKVSQSELASPAEVRILEQTLSKKRWRKIEPLDDSISCEEPYLLKEGFQILLESKMQTPRDVSKRFSMHFADLEEIAGLPQGFIASFAFTGTVKLKQEYLQSESSKSKSDFQDIDLEQTDQGELPKIPGKKDTSKVVDFLEAFAQRK